MELEELQVYQVAMEIGERIWKIVDPWNYFTKDTVGKQLVKAADSMAANLSEGYGRFFFKENRQFCYYSRESLFETKTWVMKARNRGLMTADQHESLTSQLEITGKNLNAYIKSIGRTPSQ